MKSVIAGPGTGKTRWLINTALELKKSGADSICLATFTRACCEEILNRAFELNARTIHSLAYDYVNYRLHIYEHDDIIELAEDSNMDKDTARSLETKISSGKTMSDAYNQLDNDEKKLLNKVHSCNAVVYGELIHKANESASKRFDYLLVDEYQDITESEDIFINKIADCVIGVGDPRQSIYKFRGASPKYLLDGEIIGKLNLDYRNSPAILDIANRLMPMYDPMVSVKAGGKITIVQTGSEFDTVSKIVRMLKPGCAVLVRNNKLIDLIKGYYHIGNNELELRLRLNPKDIVAKIRIKRRKKIAAERGRPLPAKYGDIRIMTMHASKGLEFPDVVLPFMNDGIITSDDRELLYVAYTRAADSVSILTDREEPYAFAYKGREG